MAKKKVLRGAKISSKHSSFIDAAVPIIEIAKTLPQVTRVVLSTIVSMKSGKKRIKFVPIQAGLRVVIRGHNAQQTLYVYTSDIASTQEKLQKTWEGK